LDGCRKVILDAVCRRRAEGAHRGSSAFVSAVIAPTGYAFSKTQFLRLLDDRNPVPELDRLEQDILNTANQLGIGPMGFGGRTTLLG